MIEKGYTTKDGFSALTKGMHSGLDPLALDSNGQYSYGVNVTTRGGFAKTRPGFVSLGKLGTGSFQEAAVFALDEADHIVYSISGVVYAWNGTTGAISRVADGLDPTAPVFATQVYRWMVLQDGSSRPVVVKESSGAFSRLEIDAERDQAAMDAADAARKAAQVADGTLENELQYVALARCCLVPGTLGAYAHGRYHFVPAKVPLSEPALEFQAAPYNSVYKPETVYAVPTPSAESGRACFVSSDILDVLEPERVFQMTEHRVLAEGGAYALPAELGFIHGMGAMRGAATGTGVGSLYVFGSRGVSAFEVSTPRTTTDKSWKDIAFSQVAFYGAGTYSPRSIVNVNDDMWYVDAAKFLRSVGYDNSQLGSGGYAGAAMFNTTKSLETKRWVDLTDDAYRPLVSAAVADNRLHWTLCGGRGVCSLDFAQVYSAVPSEIAPLHEGLWTGFSFERLLSVNGVLHAVVAQGSDHYLLRLNGDVDDLQREPISAFLVTKYYAGVYNETYTLSDPKQLSHVELLVSGISRPTSLKVYFRPIHYPEWTLLGEREFNVPAGSPPQVRQLVRFSVNPRSIEGCNSITKEALFVSHAFQFRIEWTGRLQICRFTVSAPILDQAPAAQCGVDNEEALEYPTEALRDFDYEVTI